MTLWNTGTSGLPYDVGEPGDIANVGNPGTAAYGYDRMNVEGPLKLSNPTPTEWCNKANLAPPAQYTYGNMGRAALRADSWTSNSTTELTL